MRLLVFERDGKPVLGVRDGDEVVDLSRAAPDGPQDMMALIEAGPAGLAAVRDAAAKAGADARVKAESITHAIPIPRPGKIICLGLNYAAHAAEGGHSRPEYPSFFMRGATSMIAHGAPLIRPSCCDQLDYEAEMVVVIGRRGRHVKKADALDYVFGYSLFNEGSIRAYQRKTSQWTIGKNFDGTGAFGPEIVTPDELPPGGAGLRIQTRLNGKVMQDANTSEMLFDVPEMIELLTECMTLEPGDVIVTGTPEGVGHARKPPVWMKPGDVCEVEVERIGVLRNPVEAEA